MDALKSLSPAIFGVIIFCFFLPFVNITCSGQTVMSLTGFQLITGAKYEPTEMFGGEGMFNQDNSFQQQPGKQDVDAQPLALFAFISAVIAFALSFLKRKITALICMILSAAGGIFLLLLKANLDSDTTSSGQGIVQVNYQFGYWFAFLLFIGGAILQWLMFKEPAGTIDAPPISMQD